MQQGLNPHPTQDLGEYQEFKDFWNSLGWELHKFWWREIVLQREGIRPEKQSATLRLVPNFRNTGSIALFETNTEFSNPICSLQGI